METEPDDANDARGESAPEEEVETETPQEGSYDVIASSRISRLWIRILPAIAVLVLIVVFVFQNTKDVRVRLFTFGRSMPLSVALIGAAVLGALLVLALGSARIFQLRREVRRSRRDQRATRHERRDG